MTVPRKQVHPSEKVLAVSSIFRSLWEELNLMPTLPVAEVVPGFFLQPSTKPTIEWAMPPEVMASLIDAAVEIAMHTDTSDMGLMARRNAVERNRVQPDYPDVDPLTPCDDCGRTDGTHDPEVEH